MLSVIEINSKYNEKFTIKNGKIVGTDKLTEQEKEWLPHVEADTPEDVIVKFTLENVEFNSTDAIPIGVIKIEFPATATERLINTTQDKNQNSWQTFNNEDIRLKGPQKIYVKFTNKGKIIESEYMYNGELMGTNIKELTKDGSINGPVYRGDITKLSDNNYNVDSDILFASYGGGVIINFKEKQKIKNVNVCLGNPSALSRYNITVSGKKDGTMVVIDTVNGNANLMKAYNIAVQEGNYDSIQIDAGYSASWASISEVSIN